MCGGNAATSSESNVNTHNLYMFISFVALKKALNTVIVHSFFFLVRDICIYVFMYLFGFSSFKYFP